MKKKKQKAPGRSPSFIILNMYQIHESWTYSHYMRLVHCKSVMFSHKMITAPNVLLVLCQKTLAFVQLFSQRLSKIVRSCEVNTRWVSFTKKKQMNSWRITVSTWIEKTHPQFLDDFVVFGVSYLHNSQGIVGPITNVVT